jgi:hypothetical protein
MKTTVLKKVELIVLMSCHSEYAAKILIEEDLANHVIFVSRDAELLNNGAEMFSKYFYKHLFNTEMNIC